MQHIRKEIDVAHAKRDSTADREKSGITITDLLHLLYETPGDNSAPEPVSA
jgi:hypothetical protein